jgi:glycosyltransferase involved in cell wall biosynthesis
MIFSLVVPTYNRHALLRHTLESLRRQTFADFEVLVLDDGSQPPVQSIVDELGDARFRVRRYEENLHPADILEDSLDEIRGDFFLCVEDDNGLIPSALERVAAVLGNQPEIEILGTNFLHYNHSTGEGRQAEGRGFTGELNGDPAREVLWQFCAVWGIGPACRTPRPAHFSATYYSIGLLRRAKERFGRVFVKPLGDVSLLALLGLVEKAWYLDLPLSYIGEHEGQITNAGKAGQRQRLRKSVWLRGFEFKHSPLRGLSYGNVAVDCHLAAVHRLGWQSDARSRLQPSFFRTHLTSVRSDSPWTRETWQDYFEVLPHLFTPHATGDWLGRRARQGLKLLRHPNVVWRNRTGASEASASPQPHFTGFDNCVEFAEWMEKNQVSK